jgi:superfamily I DNA and/or RNA helicase
MSAPERLNVLLSRARDCLILLGNADNFMGSRKGGELWTGFIDMLKNKQNIYDGLPVRCQQHPQVSNILRTPEDFDMKCPEGGCYEPW